MAPPVVQDTRRGSTTAQPSGNHHDLASVYDDLDWGLAFGDAGGALPHRPQMGTPPAPDAASESGSFKRNTSGEPGCEGEDSFVAPDGSSASGAFDCSTRMLHLEDGQNMQRWGDEGEEFVSSTTRHATLTNGGTTGSRPLHLQNVYDDMDWGALPPDNAATADLPDISSDGRDLHAPSTPRVLSSSALQVESREQEQVSPSALLVDSREQHDQQHRHPSTVHIASREQQQHPLSALHMDSREQQDRHSEFSFARPSVSNPLDLRHPFADHIDSSEQQHHAPSALARPSREQQDLQHRHPSVVHIDSREQQKHFPSALHVDSVEQQNRQHLHPSANHIDSREQQPQHAPSALSRDSREQQDLQHRHPSAVHVDSREQQQHPHSSVHIDSRGQQDRQHRHPSAVHVDTREEQQHPPSALHKDSRVQHHQHPLPSALHTDRGTKSNNRGSCLRFQPPEIIFPPGRKSSEVSSAGSESGTPTAERRSGLANSTARKGSTVVGAARVTGSRLLTLETQSGSGIAQVLPASDGTGGSGAHIDDGHNFLQGSIKASTDALQPSTASTGKLDAPAVETASPAAVQQLPPTSPSVVVTTPESVFQPPLPAALTSWGAAHIPARTSPEALAGPGETSAPTSHTARFPNELTVGSGSQGSQATSPRTASSS
eukprot:CAMPEP_0180564892 /NCGR_PEP_ID=MMETSP1037_2-20121125/5250_1 /TAXON_ID=632150 /ORGANISM="Azadinium spinosum, Strain 3D9" /LENGTH=660 /DNA_ID=CAMNT_0022581817 /DNA_START=68 /DNA_END=2048 /DNA_ORIENTATION=-